MKTGPSRNDAPAKADRTALRKIAVIGEILVEIMADEPGNGFRGPIALTGPFPSGAPAIFASQAARLGQPAAIVSAVGDDDFGELNLARLRADGVDISAVAIDPERPTGSAFVRYRADGSRDFVFNIAHSACGQHPAGPAADALLETADHLHIMGSSLSGEGFIKANEAAADAVKARGGTISFDPNLRKEILGAAGLKEAMARILARTDLFLPSGDELTLLTDALKDNDAIDELLERGVRAIVHKNGVQGARYADHDGVIPVPAFRVDEVDPTGAGDCFGATFTSLWLRGAAPSEALTYAAAAGALAVTRRGPMEGVSRLAELDAFLARQPVSP